AAVRMALRMTRDTEWSPRNEPRSGRAPSEFRSRREIQETGAGALEGQAHRADRAVTLLADDDLGRALVRRIGIVDLVAIDEDDHVGILLDGPGFAQIAHDGPLVGALFQAAIELRQCDHRAVQFLGQSLQRSADLRDFRGAVLAG